jgi:hypothetical protein
MSDKTQADDPVLAYLQKHGIEVTRENYLDIMFLGDPPDELSWEHELELPEALRHRPQGERPDPA